MKKGVRFLMSLMAAVLVALFIGTALGPVAGGVAFAASCVVEKPAGSLGMAVTPEIWVNYIVENLFKDNEFMLQSIDESQYVVGGSVVHIPQAGSVSKAERNRTSLPATITRRKDVDVTYALDEFTTDPRFIPSADKVELSYDKMDSCMTEDLTYIKQLQAEAMLYNWKPTYYIKASGAAAATNLVWGTGSRTSVTVADFAKAKSIFNKWNIARADRFVILDTEMYDQLCAELRASTVANNNLSAIYDPINGKLQKLEGFTIYERSTALLASNCTLTAVTGTKYFSWTSTDLLYSVEDYESILAASKNAATTACTVGLFWSKTAVSRALGATEMFENPKDATYYGDIYSFLNRCGGRARRSDGKGVLGIIQVAS